MAPRDLYDERYAEVYRALYIDHPQWAAKHALNLRLLRALFDELRPSAAWLDLACGQAWHFAQFAAATGVADVRAPGPGALLGIDRSAAQLARARDACPGAAFLCADLLDVALDARFDLVTSFWGAYAYLDDEARIAALLQRAIDWTAPGGALYLEILTPDTLDAFNALGFAGEHGAAVELRAPDGTSWRYRDPGGWHDLASPPLAFFEDRLAPCFETVALRGTSATLAQLVATGRRGPQTSG